MPRFQILKILIEKSDDSGTQGLTLRNFKNIFEGGGGGAGALRAGGTLSG